MQKSKFWEKYFRVYDVLNFFIPYQELLDKICEVLEIQPGERVLDAGCGTGNLAIKMDRRGGRVIGLDNCEEALKTFRKKNPSIKLIFADLTQKFPFPDNYFDKIASNNVLYTIQSEKLKLVLKELFRVLKPNGKLAISNPKKNWSAFKIYSYGFKKSLSKNGFLLTTHHVFKTVVPTLKILYYNHLIRKMWHYHFFQPEEQKQLLLKIGFKEVSNDIFLYGKQVILNVGTK